MEDILKYQIFPYLKYIDIRNFCQCAKIIDFHYFAKEMKIINPMLFLADNDLFTFLHNKKLKLHQLRISKKRHNFADYYCEIYRKITSEVIKGYVNIPRWVNRETFINDTVQLSIECADESFECKKGIVNMDISLMIVPFASHDFDYGLIWEHCNNIAKITLSKSLYKYVKSRYEKQCFVV